jgi:hypothetical protein
MVGNVTMETKVCSLPYSNSGTHDIVVYCKESGQITSLQKMFLSVRKKCIF